MGTTAQKLEYLGTTKSQLKDMINYGLDDNNKITSSTTFRNYVTSVKDAFLEALRNPDTLFTNLPKKSGTGANITLNDTANAPMRIELGATELTQDGTPTPSSPQDIHTISGSNKVVINGSQLFDENITPELYSYNASGVKVSDSDLCINQELNNINFSNIYVSFASIVGSAYVRVCEYNSSGTFIKRTLVNSNQSLTLDSNTKKLIFSVNTSSTKYFANLMINTGTTALPYTPYTSQETDIDLDTIEYCKIGNYEDNFIRQSDGTWELEKNIGKVVLDGTENWGQNTAQTLTNTSLFYTALIDSTLNVSQTIKSNYFNYTQIWSIDIEGIYGYSGGNDLRIRINTTTANDVASFKTWLSTHNTIVYYVLATPTYTQITGTLANQLENVYKNMLSQKGQTNISQVNNDLAFELSVSAIEDLV